MKDRDAVPRTRLAVYVLAPPFAERVARRGEPTGALRAAARRAGEVLRVWRTRLDPERRTGVVHLDPVYDAGGFDVRRLAPGVPTAGIRDAEDLAALVEIAQFAEGRARPDRRVEAFLAGGGG